MKGISRLLCAMLVAPFLFLGAANAASVTEVTDATFKQEVIDFDGVVIVEAYATWCGPCKVYGPMFEEFANKHTGNVKFVKFDGDLNPQIRSKVGLRAYPTTYCFTKSSTGETLAGGASGVMSDQRLSELISICSGPDAESKLQRFDY